MTFGHVRNEVSDGGSNGPRMLMITTHDVSHIHTTGNRETGHTCRSIGDGYTQTKCHSPSTVRSNGNDAAFSNRCHVSWKAKYTPTLKKPPPKLTYLATCLFYLYPSGKTSQQLYFLSSNIRMLIHRYIYSKWLLRINFRCRLNLPSLFRLAHS